MKLSFQIILHDVEKAIDQHLFTNITTWEEETKNAISVAAEHKSCHGEHRWDGNILVIE